MPGESVDIEKERGNAWQLMKNAWHSWPHARSVEATETRMYLGTESFVSVSEEFVEQGEGV